MRLLKSANFAAFYDAVSVIDKNFGEITKRLKSDSILDNTMVVFMSHHG
jgi:arylsulfatase A-like enzyme